MCFIGILFFISSIKADEKRDDTAIQIENEPHGGLSFIEKQQSLRHADAVEIQDRRNKYGRYFKLPNGHKAALISTAPIHYITQNGILEQIDNRIIPATNHQHYTFTNASNSFSVLSGLDYKYSV